MLLASEDVEELPFDFLCQAKPTVTIIMSLLRPAVFSHHPHKGSFRPGCAISLLPWASELEWNLSFAQDPGLEDWFCDSSAHSIRTPSPWKISGPIRGLNIPACPDIWDDRTYWNCLPRWETEYYYPIQNRIVLVDTVSLISWLSFCPKPQMATTSCRPVRGDLSLS